MKRKMADLDVLMDETLTLCKTPPVPRRHPYRQFYQYRKPETVETPAQADKPDVDMTDLAGPPMFTFGSQPDLVPKPLFSRSNSMPSRSNSLPSRSSRPSRPSRPPEPFQFNSDIVKSPSPLFSRRNTLPPRVRRATTSERRPSPLSHREDAQPPEEPTHTIIALSPPTSPRERPTLITIPPPTKKTQATPPKNNASKTAATPAAKVTTPAIPPHPTRPAPPIPSMATPSKPPAAPPKPTPSKATSSKSSSITASTPKRPSPLSGKGSARRPGPAHIAPFQPASPMVLSPVTSHTSSVTSSPTPSVFSEVASFSASAPSTPSTPATSPPSSPATRPRSPMCYFSPAYWTIATSPSPVYIPRQKLRRKDSPRLDTLRTLRAKESDACLERIYDQRTSAYMEWTGFQALTN